MTRLRNPHRVFSETSRTLIVYHGQSILLPAPAGPFPHPTVPDQKPLIVPVAFTVASLQES